MNSQLYIYDCHSEKLRASNSHFMTIGSGERMVFRLEMNAPNAGAFAQRNGHCYFFPHANIQDYSINSKRLSENVIIEHETLYLIIIAGGCILCWYGDSTRRPDFSQLNPKVWHIYDAKQTEWKGPYKLIDLPDISVELQPATLLTFHGLNNYTFCLSDILEVANYKIKQLKGEAELAEQAKKSRLYRCPTCWEQFSNEEYLAIAAHPDLRGDALLEEDAQQRFHPSKFDPYGLPIDELGLSCAEFACPHCHHKLPPFFAQTKQHIFSIIGVPSAGKSYYLATLIRELSLELAREFNLPFRDAFPASNAPLTEMSTKLFSQLGPQAAYLGKQAIAGKHYKKVWRNQHFNNIPTPYIYNVNKNEDSYSLVFYDNQGENFSPGNVGEDHPEASHIHIASSIFYLFDPITNPGFRTLLRDNNDPQMERNIRPAGMQGLTIAETEMRLRTRLNVPPDKKLDIPLALIIGKSDIWQHLLGPEPLLPTVRNGLFMPEHVKLNSERLRNFLFEVSPYICSNIEAISSNVSYFAVSALGCSPIEFTDIITGNTLLGPDTKHINPQRVCDPILWALNNIEPNLLPSAIIH